MGSISRGYRPLALGSRDLVADALGSDLARFRPGMMSFLARPIPACHRSPRLGRGANGAARVGLRNRLSERMGGFALISSATTQLSDLQRGILRAMTRLGCNRAVSIGRPPTYLIHLRRRRALRRQRALFLRHAAQRQPPFSKKYFTYSRP